MKSEKKRRNTRIFSDRVDDGKYKEDTWLPGDISRDFYIISCRLCCCDLHSLNVIGLMIIIVFPVHDGLPCGFRISQTPDDHSFLSSLFVLVR